jgi:ketopantoate reductase
MNSEVDVVGIGGAGDFLASSLYQGGLLPRVISRGEALQQLHEISLTIITDNKRCTYFTINCLALDDVQQFAPICATHNQILRHPYINGRDDVDGQ